MKVEKAKSEPAAADTAPPPTPTATPPETAAPSPGTVDLQSLRLEQNYAALVQVETAISVVPIRKPHRHAFVRVHADYGFPTALLEDRETGDVYFVAPALWPVLHEELVPAMLRLTVDREGNPSLWPIKLPQDDGTWNPWHRSAAAAATLAETRWVRLVSNKALGSYAAKVAEGELGEPAWPKISFEEVLQIALRDRYIDSREHPVLRRLRGEV